MKKLLLVLAASLGFLVLLAVLLQGPVGGPERPPDSPQPPAGPAAPNPLAGVPGGESAHNDRGAPEVRRPLPGALDVLLRGRCLDEVGRTLPGCRVSVMILASGARPEAGPWTEPAPVQSGADGRFELRFRPAPRHVQARVAAAGRVALERLLEQQECKAGAVLDAGDLVLRAGCIVRGTVRDTAGAGQQGIAVTFHRDPYWTEPVEGFAPVPWGRAESGPDGSYRLEGAIAPGTYRVGVNPIERQREQTRLSIVPGQAEAVLDLVILAELGAIEGQVVDEAARPVEGATVLPESGGRQVSTGADGAFRLQRFEGQSGDPVRLRVVKDGFEHLLTAERHSWGSKDLALVLRRGLAVEVLAVEAETGLPVEEFAVRHLWRPRGGGSQREATQQAKDPQGRVRVENVLRGQNLFVVKPADERLWPSDPVLVEVTDQGAPLQRIEVPRAGRASLLVVDEAGAPVAGTRVELLSAPPGVEATTTVMAHDPSALYTLDPGRRVLLLQAGATDAAGRLGLRGPAGVELALRLLGPGHVPMVEKGIVLLAEGGELRVAVAGSATIKGRLLPPGLAARLMPPPGIAALVKAAPETTRANMFPGLRLVRPTGRERWPAGGLPRVPFAGDGTFELADVPPGDWELEIVCNPWMEGQASATVTTRLASIRKLAAGEVRRIELDGSALMPATLIGRVFLDGEPAALASIVLLCRRPGLVYWGRETEQAEFPVRTDERGAFEAAVPPGSYTVAVPVIPGQAHRRAVCETWVQAGPGEKAARDFHVVRRKLAVMILSATGAPEAGRKFTLMQGREMSYSLSTDEHGELVVDPAPLGLFELATWPKKLAGSEEQMAYIKAHPYPEWTSVFLRLGPIDAAGLRPDVRLELRLGPEPE